MVELNNSKGNAENKQQPWLALMIGNSRLHWALFVGEKLEAAWDTPYLDESAVQQLSKCQTPKDFVATLPITALPLPIYLASVVPSQTALWQSYPQISCITLEQVPLDQLYPTLGIDRALALLGAGEVWGFPMLVIDAGTALTFTGANADRHLVGGAILPGVSLQLHSLGQRTANLPLVEMADNLPSRWAVNTPAAIQSGVIYSLMAAINDFIQAWWQEFPDSRVVLTGGDRTLLLKYLQLQFPQLAARVMAERNLIFWGIRALRNY